MWKKSKQYVDTDCTPNTHSAHIQITQTALLMLLLFAHFFCTSYSTSTRITVDTAIGMAPGPNEIALKYHECEYFHNRLPRWDSNPWPWVSAAGTEQQKSALKMHISQMENEQAAVRRPSNRKLSIVLTYGMTCY